MNSSYGNDEDEDEKEERGRALWIITRVWPEIGHRSRSSRKRPARTRLYVLLSRADAIDKLGEIESKASAW